MKKHEPFLLQSAIFSHIRYTFECHMKLKWVVLARTALGGSRFNRTP